MLTYELKKAPGLPLYEALYRCIREDILEGRLPAGSRLPSKRALAAHLEVSKITVEGAYQQLLQEGYIRAKEKVGYFVEVMEQPLRQESLPPTQPPAQPDGVDLTGSGCLRFPFSVWSRLQRQVMQDLGEKLLLPLDNRGLWELRQAISEQLAQFRGMQVRPEQILIGAGTDFLYNLLVQLLGREKIYAVEEPGYGKIRRIYAAAGASCVGASMDHKGVIPQGLNAHVLHISPSHHFPTGRITPLSRRTELLNWAGSSRYIIEDDYDSEFRFHARPMPTLYALDKGQRVIYMNTFSKTLAPSIRISYMVLPPALMERFLQELGFYGCTVPSFEQHTLARFLQLGYFEKHINRMRKTYKTARDRILRIINQSKLAPRLSILEENAGLHFLVKVDTSLTDEALLAHCRAHGLQIRSLSSYYHGCVPPQARSCLVVNYASLTDAALEKLVRILSQM